MKRHWKLWLSLAVLLGSLAALPAVHWRVIGWVRGEAFYQGMPTSYWRAECQCWVCAWIPGGAEVWIREPSGWQQFRDKIMPTSRSLPLTMALHQKDSASLPVLLALLQDKDPRIQNMTLHGLGNLGPEAREAVPTVLGLHREDPDSSVRELAGRTLWRIDPEIAAKAGVKAPLPAE